MTEGLITAEDLKGCRRQLLVHIKLAKGGVHFDYQCIEHPRLRQFVRRASRNSTTMRTMMVDGLEVKTLAEAAEALNRTPEENEAMAEQLNLEGGAGQKKWTLRAGIDECKRELHMRGIVYPTHIGRGQLTEADANKQNAALQGIQTFLEFCEPHQDLLRQLMALLKKRPEFAREVREFMQSKEPTP
jgi:hypothetical protein